MFQRSWRVPRANSAFHDLGTYTEASPHPPPRPISITGMREKLADSLWLSRCLTLIISSVVFFYLEVRRVKARLVNAQVTLASVCNTNNLEWAKQREMLEVEYIRALSVISCKRCSLTAFIYSFRANTTWNEALYKDNQRRHLNLFRNR